MKIPHDFTRPKLSLHWSTFIITASSIGKGETVQTGRGSRCMTVRFGLDGCVDQKSGFIVWLAVIGNA